jgi:hypothetical protein
MKLKEIKKKVFDKKISVKRKGEYGGTPLKEEMTFGDVKLVPPKRRK